MHFILGAKPGDHAFLFGKAVEALAEDRADHLETVAAETGVRRSYTAIAGLPLNASHVVRLPTASASTPKTRMIPGIADSGCIRLWFQSTF